MGNIHNRRLFALAATESSWSAQHPDEPPSYLASTVPGYDTSLEFLANLEIFTISYSARKFRIKDASENLIFTVTAHKYRQTGSHKAQEAYTVVDSKGKLVFTALERENLTMQPNGLFGYLYFESQGSQGGGMLRFTIYGNDGTVTMCSCGDRLKIDMLNRFWEWNGSFQRRTSSSGTSGIVPRMLDFKLKAGILFAAMITCRYCHFDGI
ncbi:hypothetical protein HOLleu_02001 [Holothuria leucospilota]|uniref:Uncharacterized protein n=1 Tax=Holothuria leucospilota TaxID=206669 RepID=A0A9Q1CRR8_HOLLE|nr:hypothetical protein HOLleu_02001 [Holothuria leucospilota]